MKKILFMFVILLLFIVGCFVFALKQSTPQIEKKKHPIHTVQKKEPIPVTTKDGNSLFVHTGQKVRQKGWATFTLKNIYTVQKHYVISNMDLYIKQLKWIELTDLTDKAKDYLYSYTGTSLQSLFHEGYKANNLQEANEIVDRSKWKIDKSVGYLDITYTIKNKNKNEEQFFSMVNVFGNNFYFYVPSQNFISSEDTLMGTTDASRIDYQPGELRNGEIGLILGDKLPSVPNEIHFKTAPLLDGESHELIHKAETFTIKSK
ncbi:hypothetical protein H5P36_18085 [Bacillus sp. APMAM]|nr:hypothetical protein [Bacillus sp. APMAM]RTZ54190.1 hypothetical protein EKO25_19465 [Bacillus sp. SAJ1]